MRYKNPFLISGYIGPAYFCDREHETSMLMKALLNGRNVTLMSPRRMGKTGLIQNVFHQLRETAPDIKCFYIDVFSTHSLRDFNNLLAQAVLGQLDTTGEKWLGRLTDFFKSCRPVISADPITRAPSVTFDTTMNNPEATLKEIFDYIGQSGKECVIAIDEFQQITEYAEQGTEAQLRSYIQFLPNVHFIFSGSKHHIMSEMFSSPKRPFFQSTQKMYIDSINREKYCTFAQLHLQSRGIMLPDTVFTYLYDKLFGHTWYIQRMLNKIYEECSGEVTTTDVDDSLQIIIAEEEYNYQKQFSLLTQNQQALLKAVAKETTVKSINGKLFIQKYQLGGTSSINRALDFLIKNEFIFDSIDGYQIYDRFFAHWLRLRL